jgi:hypothetical protein
MFAIGRESINVVGWDQRAFASAGPPFSWVDDRGPALRWSYPAKNHNLEAKKTGRTAGDQLGGLMPCRSPMGRRDELTERELRQPHDLTAF